MAKRFATGTFVTFVLAIAMARVTAAPEQQPTTIDYTHYWLAGLATRDCGKLTDDLRKGRDVWQSLYEHYLTGFVTGANYHATVVLKGLPSVGRSVSPEALLATIEQYCAAHPLDSVGSATEDLYMQLLKKAVDQ